MKRVSFSFYTRKTCYLFCRFKHNKKLLKHSIEGVQLALVRRNSERRVTSSSSG